MSSLFARKTTALATIVISAVWLTNPEVAGGTDGLQNRGDHVAGDTKPNPENAEINPRARQPLNPETRAVEPANELEPDPDFVPPRRPIRLPDHPPIEDIPPRQLPEPLLQAADAPGPFDGDLVRHNIETGETERSPAGEAREGDPPLSRQEPYGGPFDDGALSELESQLGFGHMTPATNLDQYPASAQVKLVMHFEDGGSEWFGQCSGAMIDPGVILTAGHCIYMHEDIGDPMTGWASEVWIYPAWDGEGPIGNWNTPPDEDYVYEYWGYATRHWLLSNTGWTEDANFHWDVGAIGISRNTSRQVGMITGWLGFAWGGSCGFWLDQTMHNFSYPGGCFDATVMMYWSGTFDDCESPNFLNIDTDESCSGSCQPGMSGSGAYYIDGSSRFAHAVVSSGWPWLCRYARIWDDKAEWILDLQDDVRGEEFDLEPFMLRLDGNTTIPAGEGTGGASVIVSNPTNASHSSVDFTLTVMLSPDNTFEDDVVNLTTWQWSDIDFSSLDSILATFGGATIPLDTPSGDYWLGVHLESSADTNPWNNTTVLWDAQEITVEGIDPPSNNACPNAIVISLGDTDFDTTGATTDGPAHAECQFDGQTYNDIYYNFVAPDTGTISISTCNQADYDTDLAFYFGDDCDLENNLLACNDDFPGCAGWTSLIEEVDVIGGQVYTLRIGGWNEAAYGTGTVTIEYEETCEPADLNCDGVVDVLDLLILLDEWGPCGDPDDCPADINDDGVVDVLDLLLLLENWG